MSKKNSAQPEVKQSEQVGQADEKQQKTLVEAFCDKILSRYTNEGEYAAESVQWKIQKLFDTWPVDTTTTRLALLTEVLAGYKPTLKTPGLPIGSLFRSNGIVWVTICNTDGYTYGISSTGNAYYTASDSINVAEGTQYYVSPTEAEAFVREFRNVKTVQFLTYITATFKNGSLSTLFRELEGSI